MRIFLDGEIIARTAQESWAVTAPDTPGQYRLELRLPLSEEKRELQLFVGHPVSSLVGGVLNGYNIGPVPAVHPHPDYAHYYSPPSAFYEVTEETSSYAVSEHFELEDFLCKQASSYPKYVVIDTSLLVLMERLMGYLQKQGYAVETLAKISGYRTPWYNKRIGNVPNSRHVYGDAYDFYIDLDRDGRMDDLNRDGVHNDADIDLLFEQIVAFRHLPENAGLIGGVGRYYKKVNHGGFVHVDTRGFRARW